MKASTRRVGEVLVVDVNGEVTTGMTADGMKAKISSLLEAGHDNILVNLAEVPAMDSAGLSSLVSCLRRARDSHAQFKLLRPSPHVAELLRLTQLSLVFEIFGEERAAIESFQKLPS